MTYFKKPAVILLLVAGCLFSCSSNSNSSKEVSKDTSEKKFDPAGEQKHTDTYDPKVTATDTMYKNKDSVPRPKTK